MRPDYIYFNAFNQIPEIGSVRLRKILNFFPNLEAAWAANAMLLQQCGIDQATALKIADKKKEIVPEREWQRLENAQVQMLTIFDEEYPKLLKEIPVPPVVLYTKGAILPQDELAIGVVGSRKISPYGKQVTEALVSDLVRANLSIISGLALGTDALAHKTALDYQGRTIAVLACGLDNIYPASNRLLGERILDDRGAIVSELPLGTPPLKHHFPNRNRIISGLSLGTVVIEAARESGALITAHHALDQNRQVFAVPGSIFNPMSEGPNELLKMGAKAVTGIKDILDELNLTSETAELFTEPIEAESEEEEKILSVLTREAKHFNELTRETGISSAELASALILMEMKGKVKNLGGNQYVKTR